MKKDVKRKPVARRRPARKRVAEVVDRAAEGADGEAVSLEATDRGEMEFRGNKERSQVQLGNEGNAERGTEKLESGSAFVGRDSCGRFKRREAGPVNAEGKVVGAARREVAAVAEAEESVTSGQSDEPGPNPLLDLPEKDRAKLFAWLRECPYDDAVRQVLRDEGMGEVSKVHLSEFFQREAESHWERRIARAAVEANALVQLVERSPVQFSSGILAALGQEAFRQVASGEVEPEAMGKMAMLFLKARSAERADQMQLLRREKLSREMQGQVEQALEKLAEEVEQHPGAREAFEALRREICEEGEGESTDGMTELPNGPN